MKTKLIRPTPAEDAVIDAGIASDPDTFEATPEQIAQAAKRRPGRPAAEVTKEPVTIRLDPDVLKAMRDTGPGWQTRVNEVLRERFLTHRK